MTSITRVGPNSNAFTFSFDEKILDEIRVASQTYILPYLEAPERASVFEGGELRKGTFGENEQLYYYTTYGNNPLIWVSNNNWTLTVSSKNSSRR
jgi:hypothetical protein